MAPPSPLQAEGPLRLRVVCGGKRTDELQLVSAHIHLALNEIPWATLELASDEHRVDGIPLLSESELLAPGTAIQLSAGYGGVEDLVFSGLITGQRLRLDANHRSVLTLNCHASAERLKGARRSALHRNRSDAELIAQLAAQTGLVATVDMTEQLPARHALRVQSDCSDWDFLLARARAAGLLVRVDDAQLFVQAPRWDDAAVLALTWGIDVRELDAGVDTDRLPEHARLSRARGRLSFQGSAAARPGVIVELLGVGRHFSGDLFLSAVDHHFEDDDWVTQVGFGPDLGLSSSEPVNAALGLQTGVVLRIEGDPEGEHRVLVKMQAGPSAQAEGESEEGEGVWARLLQPQAASGFGSFFVPEPGDEVLIGHLDPSAEQPVVLGALFGRFSPPVDPLTAAHEVKTLTTRGRHRIEFNDAERSLSLSTPAGNRLRLSDADGGLRIEDQNGNRIELSAAGITLNSVADVQLRAVGSIRLDAVGAMDLKAGLDLGLRGLNIGAEAQLGLSAQGGASAELSAQGQTTVRGAVVLIN